MNHKTIYLAGGCFWGVEDLFRALPGVINTEVGYQGGQTPNPTYETVKTGSTGHAEALRIEFDPSKISYATLLEKFFQLHDPTTLNRQGNDVGTQYRSVIFAGGTAEEPVAREAIAKAQARWPRPITTTIEPLSEFYPAESYHQDYLKKNPGGYTCHYWRE